jgi:predicted nucleotide-binding protein
LAEREEAVEFVKYQSAKGRLQVRGTRGLGLTDEGVDYVEKKKAQAIPAVPQTVELEDQMTESNRVFVVHGHDEALTQTVARFIEKLDFEAVILREEANAGRTIIEKLEDHAETAAFAVVLLTPDDVGAAKADAANLKPRARQNVVLELGIFLGLLGRRCVCAINLGVEKPGDYDGVIYLTKDDWKSRLPIEMKAGGLPVDMNKVPPI